MKSALYNSGRESFLDGSLAWIADDIRVCLLKSTYSFSASHKMLSEIIGHVNGRSEPLEEKTVKDGVADAWDIEIIADRGDACSGLAIYKHDTLATRSRLIGYICEGIGFPFVPALGQTIQIKWDDGPNGIFKL